MVERCYQDCPDLFDAIGTTYGGTATKTLSGNTYSYSGNCVLPNYHNRKLFGIGNVDGNSPSSPTIVTYKGPDVTQGASGDSTTVGYHKVATGLLKKLTELVLL